MPTYTFSNTKTGETSDLVMSYDEMISFLKDHPEMEQVFKMNLVDPVGIGVSKPPSDFSKHVLGRIRDSVPGADKSTFSKRWDIPREI